MMHSINKKIFNPTIKFLAFILLNQKLGCAPFHKIKIKKIINYENIFINFMKWELYEWEYT